MALSKCKVYVRFQVINGKFLCDKTVMETLSDLRMVVLDVVGWTPKARGLRL